MVPGYSEFEYQIPEQPTHSHMNRCEANVESGVSSAGLIGNPFLQKLLISHGLQTELPYRMIYLGKFISSC